MDTETRSGIQHTHPVFIVDDDPVVLKQLYWLFKDEYPILSASTYGEAIDMFLKEKPPVAILDLSLGKETQQDGIDLLRLFSETDPHFHGIILSGSIDRPRALEAVRLGAYDLLDKSIEPDELKRVVGRAYNRALLGRDIHKTPSAGNVTTGDVPFPCIVTQSNKIREMLRLLQKISATDVSVLITGESGTGKELFAKACHERSHRKDGPFIAINCGAIPENLLESELFGHEKGAFTGATESRAGKFEAANHGTLFLDEVAELHIELQVKLLRILQDKIVERVGSRTGKQLDVRIIAATNRSLTDLMAQGRFREDLYYRLSVMGFHLPPLREREGDVVVLAQHFLERFKSEYQKNQLVDFSRECLDLIKRYDWPGNIRELENRIQRAVIVSNGKWIHPSDLDIEPQAGGSQSFPTSSLNLQEARGEAEKKMLLEAFESARGNISQVARIIGTSRPTVHALIKKYGLTPGLFKE
ncbi:MAG: sigma-54-dependent transcriptional regulator [Leptospirales bacterium]